MIETDKEITNKIDGLDYQVQQIESKIKIKKILTSNIANIILFFILILHSVIFAKGLYYYISNTYIFSLLILLEFLIGIAIIAIVEKDLEKNLRMLESEDNKLKETKERVLDFASYIISYRHIESVKKGKNLYPELRYNDSMYVYNKFKNVYEEKRIRYENGEKKQVLYEIENEKEQE